MGDKTEPEKKAPSPPGCGTCPYWLEAKQPYDTPRRGMCRRYPTSLSKLATEFCGEHPELVALRGDHQADRISAAMIKAYHADLAASHAATLGQQRKGR